MGQYRFPIEYNALLDTLRESFGKNPKVSEYIDLIEPWIEQRDRTLEDYLTNLPAVPTTGYDAMVVRGGTTNASTRTYPTVFEAIRALDTLGLVTARIGIASRGGTIVETALLGALNNLTSVEVVGVDGLLSGAGFAPATRWSHGGFSTTGTGLLAWRLFEVEVNTGGTKAEFFNGGTINVAATRCKFTGTTGALSPTIVTTTGVAWLFQCEATGCSPGGTQMFDCYWNLSSVAAISTAGFQMVGGEVETGGADTTLTCTGTNPVVILGTRFNLNVRTITILSTTARRVVVTGECERISNGKLTLTISGHTNIHVDVADGFSATIGAAATGLVTGNFFGGTWTATTDFTGPLRVDAGLNRTTVRGKGVTGDMQIFVESTPAGTALTGVGLTDSALVISARLAPGVAAGTQKSFAFDAACLRDVIVFSGKNEFPTAGTNLGTKVLIIDEDGIPSTGLPDVIVAGGPIGSSTRTPIFTWDAKGRLLSVTDAATVATAAAHAANHVRNGSDALDGVFKDFTQRFLMG